MRIEDITRIDIAQLMGEIEAGKFKAEDGTLLGGEVMADRVLGRLSKLMNWHATRDNFFVSPIVKGMKRANEKARARKRVLTDDEIRAFWKASCRAPHQSGDYLFGALCRVLFLTAQRRSAVAGMLRSEISPTGVWSIPAARDKGNKDRSVPLPATALQTVQGMNEIDDSDLIFTTNGKAPFSGFSQSKRFLDTAMLAKLRRVATDRGDDALLKWVDDMALALEKAHSGDEEAEKYVNEKWWRLHDLRRTAKTLMARAGVRPDISERVLGHEITGVEGIYDRWDYMAEKRAALECLEAIIKKIIAGSDGAEIVPLQKSV